MTDEATFGIGHNAPPSLEEDLEERNENLRDLADALKASAERAVAELTAPGATRETLSRAILLIGQIQVAMSEREARQDKDKLPYSAPLKTINGHYKEIEDTLAEAKALVKNCIEGAPFARMASRLDTGMGVTSHTRKGVQATVHDPVAALAHIAATHQKLLDEAIGAMVNDLCKVGYQDIPGVTYTPTLSIVVTVK